MTRHVNLSHIDIVSHMCVWRPIPASCYSRPSSSPLPRTVTFMSKKMLRASCRSSTPFLLQLSLDSLPAAFASIHPCRRLSLGHICSSYLHRVHRLWCTVRLVYHPSHLAALLVLACLGLSSPCSPSLSLSPSLFLSLSLSQLYFIASFSLYMVSLIYALHSPSNCTWLSHFCPCRPACHIVDAHPLLALVAVNHCLSIFSFARADGVSSPLVMPYLCF